MNDLVKNIFRLAVFLLVQVYILDKIHLSLYAVVVPVLYYLFILWLPFSISRVGLLAVGFGTGLALDYFVYTPGLHAAACVLVAYVRPFLINVLIPQDKAEFNYREPSPKAMGWAPYGVYALVLTLLHHTYLYFLEWLYIGDVTRFVVKVAATTGISLLLVLTVELLFARKQKFRTNTA